MTDEDGVTRRAVLAAAVGAVSAAVLGEAAAAEAEARAPGASGPTPVPAQQTTVNPGDAARTPGAPTSAVSARSPFVQAARAPTGFVSGASNAPLQHLAGTITPSDLHFEVNHAGVPSIDPTRHTLLIHGLVDRPTVFSLDDIKRLPQVTRTCFIECAGNGARAFGGGPRGAEHELTPQQVAGLTSNSEWSGVPLRTLFEQAGVRSDATWFLAEGGDACLMARSIPIEKAWDDALVVWAQNGEPLRPQQGYPLRLLLPGWEGSANVKWLRRLELGTRPWMTRWETAVYTDPLSNGTARQFSFEMDAKSIITSPAHPETVTPGWRTVSGLAWSGRGRITRVQVSTDSAATWSDAKLQEPVLSKAHVRFNHMWKWDGAETILLSHATDETGYTQPTRSDIIRARGFGTLYHYNPVYGWKVMPDGKVLFHGQT